MESRAQKETEQYCEDIPVRALRLQASNGTILTPENAWTEVTAQICRRMRWTGK